MIFGVIWCVGLIVGTPRRILHRINRLARRAAVVGFRVSGLLCLIGITLGFSSVSWVIYRLLWRSKGPKKCAVDNGSPCQRGANSSANGQEPKMGHEQSKNNGAMSYADLRRKHDQVPDDTCLGAQVHEANTGAAITGGMVSCYNGSKHSEPDICPIDDFPQSASEDDPSLSERGNSKNASDVHDIMKDSGFQEPTKQTNGGDSRSSVSTYSEPGLADLPSESASCVAPSDQSTILEQRDDTLTPQSAVDSRLSTTTIRRALTLPVPSDVADTPEVERLGDSSSIDTMPGYSHCALWTPGGSSLDTTADEEAAPAVDDVFSSTPPVVLSYAAQRRKSFREAKYGGSLPARPPLSKDISRSTSTISDYSFDAECGTEIPPSTSFSALEQELEEIHHSLITDLATVARLTKADTGEYFSSPLTSRKLSNMVADSTPELKLSRAQINKVFSILRKHSSLSCESPRMSSLPPTPEYKKSSDYQVEAELTESKSFHDIPRYVVHEDLQSCTDIVSEDMSIDSMSTVETYVSSGRCDSIPSMNSMISEDGPTQDENCSHDLVVDIAGYVSREWKGDTRKADLIRKGYHCVMNEHKCRSLVQIRGDNYCGLRAPYCSMILNGVETNLSLEGVMQRLEKMHNADPTLLNKWIFPQSISDISPNDKFSQLKDCLLFYLSKTQSLCRLPSRDERRRTLFTILNTGASDELFLLEAMKLLMLLSAYELHQAYVSEQEVPVFVWLLFARDTSETVASFLRNHINRIGQDAGLEQVEMCLLGHALGVTLQTFRLYQYGEMDFIALYPEDGPSNRLVPVIAEDDRHYNTPLLTTAD